MQKQFEGAGYGWSRDAVNGALLCLIAAGFVRAAKNGQPLSLKGITQPQIGQTDFYSEGATVTTSQRIALRTLLMNLGFQIKSGEEAEAVPRALQHLVELAATAGGESPRPEIPPVDFLKQLQALSGNTQLLGVYEHREDLRNSSKAWIQASTDIAQRWPQWQLLQRLLVHARNMPVAAEVDPQIDALKNTRALLRNPDPVPPLLQKVASALRTELQTAHQRLIEAQKQELQGLGAFQAFQSLTEAERQRMLQQHEFGSVPELKIGTSEELLLTLDETSIATWEYRIDAPKGRAQRVREEAVKLQIPEAKHITLTPHHATLKSAEEAETYIAELRAEIMTHIAAGNPVII